MRLNSLLGLGGKAAQEPASKRQKRSDVLQSLGLGSSKVAAEPKPRRLAVPGLSTLLGTEAKPTEAKPAPVEAAPAPEEAAPAPEEAEPAPVEAEPPAEAAANGSNGDKVQKAQAQAWRNAFAQAQDQWSVSDNQERCFYHDTERDLFFEWDQGEGLLFQYFSQGQDEKGSVERAPIWSAACPETHAEVWQVLPMPPTDPGAELGSEEAAPETAENVQSPPSSDIKKDAETSETFEMPPPPKKKKLPPVPIMARSTPEDEDEDGDGDLKLPESKSLPGVVMGCEGPPPACSSSSSSSSTVGVSHPEEPEDDEDPGGRSLVLEEGEEVDDLAAEDCALPEAPAPVDFQATDLDLDMFG